MVVDKPAGVVVHPARGHRTGTLAQALVGRGAGGEEPWRAGIVHRLDRDTSGLLVVAKSDPVHRALKGLLAQRRLRREYRALVDGRPEARSGTIEAPIGRDRRERTLMSIDSEHPREARTHFEILRALPESTLLAGRARHRSHPPDPRPPGGDRPSGMRRQAVRRQPRATGSRASSCTPHGCAFTHPVTGEPLDVSSPLPDDLADGARGGRAPGQAKSVGGATRPKPPRRPCCEPSHRR